MHRRRAARPADPAPPPPRTRVQIPKVYTHYAATILFFFFGFKTLYDVLYKHDEVGGQQRVG